MREAPAVFYNFCMVSDAMPAKRAWMECLSMATPEPELCMIEARPKDEFGDWEFRCRKVWESRWHRIEATEDLVRKAECPSELFDSRFPQCILRRYATVAMPMAFEVPAGLAMANC